MTLTIGSDKSNDIVINHAEIAPFHYDAKVISYEMIHLTDKTNTFTTKVNGKSIVSVRLKKQDQLSIGSYTPDIIQFFDQIIEVYKQKKTDYTKEFSALMEQFQKYQKQKDQINKNPVGPIIARAAVTIVTMALIFKAPFVDQDDRYIWMSASGIIAMIVGSLIGPSVTKRNEKLDLLLLEYENILVCPKCNSKMIYQSFTYWQGKKKCINTKCNAIYQH